LTGRELPLHEAPDVMLCAAQMGKSRRR
jgi:hypothetical protein